MGIEGGYHGSLRCLSGFIHLPGFLLMRHQKYNEYRWISPIDNHVIKAKEKEMPGKKTSNMLVRDIPIDVWERIDKLCRRRNLKRRDFVEQALRFFEGETTEPENVKRESVQSSHFDRLSRDFEDLKRDINKHQDNPKAKGKIDMTAQKKRVSLAELKPDKTGTLIMEPPDPSRGVSSPEGGIKVPLTTVYCWSLDP